MELNTYTVCLTFDTLRIQANLADAAAPVRVELEADDGERHEFAATPFQTADCRHDPRAMARMVIAYLGADYWLDPTATVDDEAGTINGMPRADYIDSLIVSIT
jgi:hypothetical protein